MNIRALELIPQWVTDNVWETVTTFLSGAGLAAGAYFKRRFDAMVDQKMNTDVCPVLVDSSWDAATETIGLMEELRHVLSAVRVVLMVTENGNGIPIDKPVRATIITESYADGEMAAKPFWQERPIDSAYSKIINEVYANGHAVIMTEKLPECDLKHMYRQGGVGSSFASKVHHSEKRFFYLVMNLNNNGADKFPNQEHVNRVARAIGGMFERNPKIAEFIRHEK